MLKNHDFGQEEDLKRDTMLIDTFKLSKFLVGKIKNTNKHLIIDSHLSHYIPSKYADLCVIMACSNLKTLKTRLKKRGYNALKIRENIDSEIFQVCKIDATEIGHTILLIDSSRNINFTRFLNAYGILFDQKL